MIKYIGLLSALLLIVIKTSAQDTTRIVRKMKLQTALGMGESEYKQFSDSLIVYDKRLTDIINDKNIDKNTRGSAMAEVLNKRKAFIQTHLTEDQRKKLSEFNKVNSPMSPRGKRQAELAERLKKKGITVVNLHNS